MAGRSLTSLSALPPSARTGDTGFSPSPRAILIPSENALARELLTARLDRKDCISEPAQCYHFEFVVEGLESFPFDAGQFVSAVAPDANGKLQTRAYSLASAANKNRFDLCVNRVENGFFSNHLADLADLPVGDSIEIHGPHGHFVLHQPVTDSILIATGTGIAPMRGYLQWLFPEGGEDRSEGKQIWLVYGTRYESDIYYRAEFEALAKRQPNFHYLPTLSRADASWTGLRGYVQEHVGRILEERAARLGQTLPVPPVDATLLQSELRFDIYAYICGLNSMVSGVREALTKLGWHRKQVVFERYD
jgi:ferredoxin-NADP reductase